MSKPVIETVVTAHEGQAEIEVSILIKKKKEETKTTTVSVCLSQHEWQTHSLCFL